MSDQPFLSVVIPAYNEEQRLPATLHDVVRWLESQPWFAEVIVADDGSTDATASVVSSLPDSPVTVRLLQLPHRGKAATVSSGVLAATGKYVMFIDADLSTPLRFIHPLIEALDDGAGVAFGSREGAGSSRHGEPMYRHLMGRVFNTLVRIVAVPGVNDTQCGFKAFRAEVARDIFPDLRLYDGSKVVVGPRVTGFDVEILFLARRRGYRLVEVPVEWTHVPGSKVAPLSDSIRMFADVLRVRLNAIRGRYD